jgi:hypothetical protein
MKQVFGNLLKPRRNGVCMLRPHRLQCPQDNQIERSLQNGDPPAFSTCHPSALSTPQYAPLSLACQVVVLRRHRQWSTRPLMLRASLPAWRIGVSVFGRDESFEPGLDPMV